MLILDQTDGNSSTPVPFNILISAYSKVRINFAKESLDKRAAKISLRENAQSTSSD